MSEPLETIPIRSPRLALGLSSAKCTMIQPNKGCLQTSNCSCKSQLLLVCFSGGPTQLPFVHREKHEALEIRIREVLWWSNPAPFMITGKSMRL